MKDIRSWVTVALCMGVAACSGTDASNEGGNATVQDTGTGQVAVAEEPPGPAGPRVSIRVAGIEVEVEIADDAQERARGLMFRESLEENHGMLFIYESEQRLGFWMKNTLIPLDIAYADREGRIVDIRQMEPQDQTTIYSAAPAMYALEMNQGWFEANGVRVGDRIEF